MSNDFSRTYGRRRYQDEGAARNEARADFFQTEFEDQERRRPNYRGEEMTGHFHRHMTIPQATNRQAPKTIANPPPLAPRMTGRNGHIGVRIQNGSDDSHYGAFSRNRPPFNVQPPQGIAISLIEICTFFPEWCLIPKVIMRAWLNGWTLREIARAKTAAMDQCDKEHVDKIHDAVKYQKKVGAELYTAAGGAMLPVNDLTSNGWRLRSQMKNRGNEAFGHISLADVYGSVPRANWPSGDDRLLLTRCLEFAADNPQLDLDTSHFGWIIDHNNFALPNHLLLTSQHDKDAKKRLNARVPNP